MLKKQLTTVIDIGKTDYLESRLHFWLRRWKQNSHLWMNKSLRHLSSTCQSPSDCTEMTHESFPIWSPGLPFLMPWSMIVFLIWWLAPFVDNIPWLLCLILGSTNFSRPGCLHNSSCLFYHLSGWFVSCLTTSEFKP